MNATRRTLSILLAAALAVVLAAPSAATAAEAKDGLAAVVDTIPKCDPDGKHTGPSLDVAEKAIQYVIDGKEAGVLALIGMFKNADKNEDYKAYYLFHAVATHVKRPGAEADRKMMCDAIATALAAKQPTIVKARLLEELKWIGGEESVGAVSKLLLDKDVYSFAAEALVALKAAAPIRSAVGRAAGKNQTALIQALGDLRAAKGVPPVVAALTRADHDARLIAGYAAANSGEPAAVAPMLKAVDTQSAYERSQVIENLLLLARRLGEAGDMAPAKRICQHLLKTQTGDANVHVQCATLLAFAQACGDEAMDEVLAAMGSDNPSIRSTAIEAAIAMRGAKATEHWVQRLETATPASKVGLLSLLARRADAAALPAVLEATKDADAKVRAAAIKTIGAIGDEKAVAPLAALLGAKDSAERAAARGALLQLRGTVASAAIAKAVGQGSPEVRATLLAVLAAREAKDHIGVAVALTGDADRQVARAAVDAVGRLADYKELPVLTKLVVSAEKAASRKAAETALVGACERLPDKRKCVAAVAGTLESAKGQGLASLLRVLGTIGDRTALNVVRTGLKNADAAVQDAALRALADWRTAEPAAELLAYAQKTDKMTHHVIALRGYVRMIGLSSGQSTAERLAMAQKAMAAARRAEEKREVLGAIGGIADPKGFGMVEPGYQDAGLKNEAALASIRIAQAVAGAYRSEAKAAVKRAMAATDNKDVGKQGEKVLYEIERSEDFITGWMVSGPYKGGIGDKKKHPPEQPDAKDVKWELVSASGRQPGVVDLHKTVSRGGSICAYLRCQLWSEKAQDARIESGSDDGIRVWLNGTKVYEKEAPRSLVINEDKFGVKLTQGWNTLMVRVSEGGGDWSVCVRVRSADGKKLPGLKFKAE